MLAAAPTEVRDLVRSQLSEIVESFPSGLRLGALVVSPSHLWSASSGVQNLMSAINRAYQRTKPPASSSCAAPVVLTAA